MALHMSLQLGGELRIKIADFTCCVFCSALLHIFGLRKGCFTDAASLVLLSDVIFQGKVASKGLFAKLTDSPFLLVFNSQILPLSHQDVVISFVLGHHVNPQIAFFVKTTYTSITAIFRGRIVFLLVCFEFTQF